MLHIYEEPQEAWINLKNIIVVLKYLFVGSGDSELIKWIWI